jgi:hypothetical protein
MKPPTLVTKTRTPECSELEMLNVSNRARNQ